MQCAPDAVWSRQHGGVWIALATCSTAQHASISVTSAFCSIRLKIGQDLFSKLLGYARLGSRSIWDMVGTNVLVMCICR